MISDELIPIACHPKRWKFCMSEDKTKRNKTDFCWVMLWMYTIREYFVTETPYEYLVILTVQFFFLVLFFLGYLSENTYLKNFQFFLGIIYIGNIRTFWHRKLYIKNW